MQALRQKIVLATVIPKGCTVRVQTLGVFVFSVFKQHHDDVAEELIEKNGLRSSLKLTASQSRTLCIRLNCSAWLRTLKGIDFEKSFQDLDYVWIDDPVVSPRTMPSFRFDPISVDYPISTSDNNDEEEEENRIDTVAVALAQQYKNMSSNKKQLMLANMWK